MIPELQKKVEELCNELCRTNHALERATEDLAKLRAQIGVPSPDQVTTERPIR